MPKRINYAELYTLRKDGWYQASYTDDTGRHFVYDRDPERLWHRLNDPKEPERVSFRSIADTWQRRHWERIGYKTAEAYTAPLRRILEHFSDFDADQVTAQEINAFLVELGKQGYSVAPCRCTGIFAI